MNIVKEIDHFFAFKHTSIDPNTGKEYDWVDAYFAESFKDAICLAKEKYYDLDHLRLEQISLHIANGLSDIPESNLLN